MVGLADNQLYGKSLFTWLSLVMSLMMSVFEGFPTYSYMWCVVPYYYSC